MNSKRPQDLSELSMRELFRIEADEQTGILNHGLLALERAPHNAARLETLMRAAHSLKGAARIVHLPDIVTLAHAMEDCFVEAQKGHLVLARPDIDILLRGVDLVHTISQIPESGSESGAKLAQDWVATLKNRLTNREPMSPEQALAAISSPPAAPLSDPNDLPAEPDRVLRLTAENLNRLLALAGESLVESRWLRPFSDSMQRLRRLQDDVGLSLDGLRGALDLNKLSEHAKVQFNELLQHLNDARAFLGERLQELDSYDRRSAQLAHRLYLEVLRARMRPFGDGALRFPRMIRDIASSLGKQVRFELVGADTQVDRDILERLDAPLTHLLRNAVDHGCETPEERAAAGKPAEATIRLEARHSAGVLLVTVADDGAGVDPEKVRQCIIQKKLAPASVVEKLTETELLEFLFLPGFTLKESVTEISGRGVGLNVVQETIKSVRGSIRAATQPGRGTRFQMHLPITLSVLRTLLVEIGGEPYAFPLAQIARTLKLPRERIEALEGHHHFRLGNDQIGLMTASQVLGIDDSVISDPELPVVILGDRNAHYGLVVDRLLGERELVVQPIDPRLGKVKDISAAALMEDGAPVLIIDTDDMMQSIAKLVAEGSLGRIERMPLNVPVQKRKRILAVDDSLTVRELERKILSDHGYHTDIAVDGMDGWNALRNGQYDLVITDVDMPRLDGIELTSLIKRDARLKSLPVMIVSYKDREEDRLRGLSAGADYYLTKGNFDDATLIDAVVDLIGEAHEE